MGLVKTSIMTVCAIAATTIRLSSSWSAHTNPRPLPDPHRGIATPSRRDTTRGARALRAARTTQHQTPVTLPLTDH